VDAAFQDWDKSLGMDGEQTERILGLRETGFGDSALEQLPDATREEMQKLAGELKHRSSPAGHMALAFLAEQQGNSLQMTTEAELVASAVKKDLSSTNCTETDVTYAVQTGAFSKVLPCAEKVLSSQSSAEFRVAVASALV
jgi:hypothetical protein